jgi:hypothetical protein
MHSKPAAALFVAVNAAAALAGFIAGRSGIRDQASGIRDQGSGLHD